MPEPTWEEDLKTLDQCEAALAQSLKRSGLHQWETKRAAEQHFQAMIRRHGAERCKAELQRRERSLKKNPYAYARDALHRRVRIRSLQ